MVQYVQTLYRYSFLLSQIFSQLALSVKPRVSVGLLHIFVHNASGSVVLKCSEGGAAHVQTTVKIILEGRTLF
jgi:hypothetical protein